MSFKDFLARNTPKSYENVNTQPPSTTLARELVPNGANPYAAQPVDSGAAQQPVQQGQAAPGIQVADIAVKLDPILSVVEQVTGLTRREIFLQLLKTGVKGGGIGDIIGGLMGAKPAPQAKFLTYTKHIVIWGLVAVFFGGLILITMIGYAHLMTRLLGV